MPGQVHDLSHFCFSDFISVDATYADSATVHMQHDPRRLLARLLKEPLEHVDDKLHRRVIVVEHQHLIHCRLARLRARLDHNPGVGSFRRAAATFVVVAHRARIPFAVPRATVTAVCLQRLPSGQPAARFLFGSIRACWPFEGTSILDGRALMKEPSLARKKRRVREETIAPSERHRKWAISSGEQDCRIRAWADGGDLRQLRWVKASNSKRPGRMPGPLLVFSSGFRRLALRLIQL